MRRHFTRTSSLIAAAMLAATASAQSQPRSAARKYAPTHTAATAKPTPRKAAQHPARTLPVAMDQVVSEQPEGTLHANQAYRNTYHYYNWDGEVENAESEAILIDYVMAPDGTIWLKSPISLLETGWVRLDMEDEDIYVAHTPQLVMEDEYDIDDDGNPYRAYATRLVLRNDGNGYYYYPDGTSDEGYNLDMRFSYVDGVLRQMQDSCVAEMDNMPYEVLGLTYADGDWAGYATGNITIYPVDEEAAYPPEEAEQGLYTITDLTLDTYTGQTAERRQIRRMAMKGSEAWLATPDDTGAWLRGTQQEGGDIVFEKQYLGANADYGTHLWFLPAEYGTEETGDEWEPYAITLSPARELRLTPDGNGGYTTQGNQSLVVNASPDDKVVYVSYSLAPALTPFHEVAAKPATPDIWEYYAYDEDNGYGLFSADIPETDTEGQLLNSEKLSYVVYLGDQNTPCTFTTDKYIALSQDMTEVPYNFTDNYDIFVTAEYGHTIYLYTGGYDRVGVQSIYRGAGEERRSDIGWSDGEVTDGIAATTTAATAPAARYDLQGRRITKPTRGISIVRMADGTVRKQVVR